MILSGILHTSLGGSRRSGAMRRRRFGKSALAERRT